MPCGSLKIDFAGFIDVGVIEPGECALGTKGLSCADRGDNLFCQASAVGNMFER